MGTILSLLTLSIFAVSTTQKSVSPAIRLPVSIICQFYLFLSLFYSPVIVKILIISTILVMFIPLPYSGLQKRRYIRF